MGTYDELRTAKARLAEQLLGAKARLVPELEREPDLKAPALPQPGAGASPSFGAGADGHRRMSASPAPPHAQEHAPTTAASEVRPATADPTPAELRKSFALEMQSALEERDRQIEMLEQRCRRAEDEATRSSAELQRDRSLVGCLQEQLRHYQAGAVLAPPPELAPERPSVALDFENLSQKASDTVDADIASTTTLLGGGASADVTPRTEEASSICDNSQASGHWGIFPTICTKTSPDLEPAREASSFASGADVASTIGFSTRGFSTSGWLASANTSQSNSVVCTPASQMRSHYDGSGIVRMRSPGSYILVRGDVTSLPAVSPMTSPHALARSPVESSRQSPARSPVRSPARDRSLMVAGQNQQDSKDQCWINHLEELVARTVRERERVTGCVRQQLEELEEIVVQATGANAASCRIPTPAMPVNRAPSRCAQHMPWPPLSTRSPSASPLRVRSLSHCHLQTPPRVVSREPSREPPCDISRDASPMRRCEASPMQRSAASPMRRSTGALPLGQQLDSGAMMSPLRGRLGSESMAGRALFVSRGAEAHPRSAPVSSRSGEAPLSLSTLARTPQLAAPRALTPPPPLARAAAATPRAATPTPAPSLARWAVAGGSLLPRQPSPLVRGAAASSSLWRPVAPMSTS